MNTIQDPRPLSVEVAAPIRPRRLRRAVLAVLGALALALTAALAYTIGNRAAPEPGRDVSDAVMLAWRSADADDIAAIYADDAIFVFDGEQLAVGREQITAMIDDAVNATGNTYETVGPVSQYVDDDGDLYITSLVEVVGPAHGNGVPIVSCFRVRDGMVIRHIVVDAEHA